MTGNVSVVGVAAMAVALQTLLALSKVKLFSNNILVTDQTEKSEFIESNFTGYLAQTATTVGDPIADPVNGGISITFPSHQFATDDPTTIGETVYGFWVELAAGGLICAGNFDEPIQMTAPGQGIPMQVTLNLKD